MANKMKFIFGISVISFLTILFSLLDLYLSVVLLLGAFVFVLKFPKLIKFTRMVFFVCLLLSFVSVEFFYRMEKWSQYMRASPDSISDGNLAGLYVFHGVMTFTGFIPFPEVGREAFFLQFGGGEPKKWEKDFSLISDKISSLAKFHERKIKRVGHSHQTRLRWKATELRTYYEIRSALAVGCQKAFLKTRKLKNGFSHVVFCRVSYPNSRMQIARVGKHALYFDEGLFLLLEKRGWFTPYDARWQWKNP